MKILDQVVSLFNMLGVLRDFIFIKHFRGFANALGVLTTLYPAIFYSTFLLNTDSESAINLVHQKNYLALIL